jgi:hypothetical protein
MEETAMANEGALFAASGPDNRERGGMSHRAAPERPRTTAFDAGAKNDFDISLPAEQETATSQKPPMRRLSLNLPESLYEDLAALADSQGKTMTEVVRTGLGLAHIAYTQVNKRQKLMITNIDGDPIREILIPR